jgi:hypothetical protein
MKRSKDMEICENYVGKDDTVNVEEPFIDPQGKAAATNGLRLEAKVEAELEKLGMHVMSHREFESGFIAAPEGSKGLLLKRVPHITPYGTQGYHEFSLRGVVPGNVRIECRSQQVAGTADEKLMYLLDSVKIMQEGVSWIILDGDGFRPGAKDWIKKSADAVKYKKIKVFNSFAEWKNWINVVFA